MFRKLCGAAALAWCGALAAASAQTAGWQLPASAADEKNPLAVNAATMAGGRRLYREHCQRCHGPQGKGNGSDADPKYAREMDLTSAARADRNPDGVVFHKIWSGRERPKMPPFKDKLTKDQVWSVVAYVQSLRAKDAK